ncbi:HNH endonuclease [Streptomyces bohaiensis]|uniref:HNH endonuclease n=1 Tax=Streptomyces bohaiensis TaxID=1431344 RepID=UPI003B7B6610
MLKPLAGEVDHIDGLGPLGPRGHDPTNLRSMTKQHHSRATARAQPGGWADREP